MRTAIMLVFILFSTATFAGGPLVLQSDFGMRDSAVASMKGVAVAVSPDISIYDLTTVTAPAFRRDLAEPGLVRGPQTRRQIRGRR
jgi:hypothetical protein